MSTAIGPAIISIGAPEEQWQRDLAIVRAMRPDLLKVPIETAFSPFPSRIRALADEFKPSLMIMSLGMEAIDEGWPRVKLLIGQQLDTITAHPEIEYCCEIGNEAEYHDPPWGKAKDQWGYRYRVLQLAKQIRAEWPLPNLKIGCSMPVFLDAARDVVLSRDEWGCVADDLDYLCTHYYGHEFIGDNAGDGRDFNAAWTAIYEMLLGTGKRVIFTEIGINAPSSDMPTKARRLLDWLNQQPEQTVGAAVWCVGEWEHYAIDIPGARVYGKRNQQRPAPTPPPTTPASYQHAPQGATMYGIRGLIDVRSQLPTNPNGGPGTRVALSEKRGVVVHYDGPPVDPERDVLDVAKADAVYHTSKTKIWGYGANGQPLYGDGLMYHICIGQDGQKLLCRDLEAVLWHCGAWPQNATALAVHLNIGGDQRATPEALQALREVCDDWIAAGHGGRNEVWGHQELNPTSCPGTLMQDFVYPYREGMQIMASGQWFPETKHYVGGGFYQYWLNHGGLTQFGYPLTDEIAEVCEDGKPHTVQYFERCIMEWHPENQPPYDILLRRLGAAALAAKH